MTTSEIRIFVSSTTEDLKESCRPIAIDAIRMHATVHVSAAVMEDWIYEHDDAVLICRRELQNSSHYMGLFAYRRGWIPAKHNDERKSITELEYDWAARHLSPRRMFILMPEKDTKIAIELRIKAGGQTAAEYDAQQAFLHRVRQNGNCCFFKDLDDMQQRIRFMINRWRTVKDSLLDHVEELRRAASDDPNATAEVPIIRRASARPQSFKREHGHRKHREQFVTILSNIEESAATPGACFIIHGAEDHGHDELIDDLRRKLPPECCNLQLTCTSFTGANTARSFFDQLANWLADDDEDVSPAAMASAAEVAGLLKQKKLIYQHVVLQVHDVTDFQGGLKAFLTDFWQPLVTALARADAFRLILFVAVTGPIPDDCQPLFWQAAEADDDLYEFNPMQAVVLPKIKPFSQKEIAAWLKSAFPGVEDAHVQAEAANIFRRTKGLPVKVYRELQKLHPSTKRVSYAR